MNELKKFGVKYSRLSKTIYAGKLVAKGTLFGKVKYDVTNDALLAVLDMLVHDFEKGSKGISFKVGDDEEYMLTLEKVFFDEPLY